MGTSPDKGPNPYITDPNDSRYTPLNNYGKANSWVTAGLIGEAQTFLGYGFDLFIVEKDLKANVEAGDIVLIGNRAGRVTAVTSAGGLITSITVYEDLRYLPEDYRATPAAYGYNNDTTGVGRTITYVMGTTNDTAGAIRNGGGLALIPFTGSLLILKQNKIDPSSWSKLAQSVYEFNNSFNQTLVGYAASTTGANPCTPTTPAQDRTVYAANLAIGTTVYMNAFGNVPIIDGVFYLGPVNGYINVVQGKIAEMPGCDVELEAIYSQNGAVDNPAIMGVQPIDASFTHVIVRYTAGVDSMTYNASNGNNDQVDVNPPSVSFAIPMSLFLPAGTTLTITGKLAGQFDLVSGPFTVVP